MAVGFAFVFGSVACDTLSNRIDVFFWLLGDRALAKTWQHWFAAGDDTFKLLAAGCFVATFISGWQLARRLATPMATRLCRTG